MYANSRDVVEYFDKRADNVLRDIEALLSEAPAIALNFEEIEQPVKVGFGYRSVKAYNMTRDGFTLLAMRLSLKDKLYGGNLSAGLRLPLDLRLGGLQLVGHRGFWKFSKKSWLCSHIDSYGDAAVAGTMISTTGSGLGAAFGASLTICAIGFGATRSCLVTP